MHHVGSMNSRTKNTSLSQAPMTSQLPENVFVLFFLQSCNKG